MNQIATVFWVYRRPKEFDPGSEAIAEKRVQLGAGLDGKALALRRKIFGMPANHSFSDFE